MTVEKNTLSHTAQMAFKYVALGALFALSVASTAQAQQTLNKCPEALNFKMTRLQDDKPLDLCQFAGKPVLVVNTASYCGYTGQYKELEQLAKRYAGKLTVLGVPSNDFGGQEPKSNKEIADFCFNTFGVGFPMTAKSRVLPGPGQAPLYRHLTAQTGKAPSWNFNKYLIAKDGKSITHFDSNTPPLSEQITSKL